MNVPALPRFPEPPPAIRIQADATPVPPGRLIGLVWFRIRRRLSTLSLLVRLIPEFLVGWRRWHFWRLAAQAVVVTLLVFTCLDLLAGALPHVRDAANRQRTMDNRRQDLDELNSRDWLPDQRQTE